MNLYKVNLNLLKVFLVIMQERQVTAAAKKLHITQPAVSNSLNQLRELLDDDLFIRGQKEMMPTQKALSLLPQIEQAFLQLETAIFYTKPFAYQTAIRTFNLGMSDYAEFVILPKLYAVLKQKAPHISLKVLPFTDFTVGEFERGDLELGIDLEKKIPSQLNSEYLFSDGALCVSSMSNTLFDRSLTLKRYLQAEHLSVCSFPHQPSRVDMALKKINVTRNVKLMLPDILPALQTIATSELIGTFSKHVVMSLAPVYQLKYLEPPFAIPEMSIVQVWHRQQENDSGLLWLRALIKEICQQYFS